METEQFQEWFDSVFLNHVKDIDGNKLLLFDGHLSHVTLELVKKARENNVHIIKLPPHSTNYLQPMDVGVFKPMKAEWRKIIAESNVNTNFKNIDNTLFCNLFQKLVESNKAFLRRHAICGFEDSGIFPPNLNKMLAQVLDNGANNVTTDDDNDAEDCDNDVEDCDNDVEKVHKNDGDIDNDADIDLIQDSLCRKNESKNCNECFDDCSESGSASQVSCDEIHNSEIVIVNHDPKSKKHDNKIKLSQKENETPVIKEKNISKELLASISDILKQNSTFCNNSSKKTILKRKYVAASLTTDESIKLLEEDIEKKKQKKEVCEEKKRERAEKKAEREKKQEIAKRKRLEEKIERDKKKAVLKEKQEKRKQEKKKEHEKKESQRSRKKSSIVNNQIACYNCKSILNEDPVENQKKWILNLWLFPFEL